MARPEGSTERFSVTSQLVLPILLKPILMRIERKQPQVARSLSHAFSKAEAQSPGLLHDLVIALFKKADIGVALNISESLLRLQSHCPEFDDLRIRRPEEIFQELNKKCTALKKILSRIPDEINERAVFLETIKEIASGIKKVLDCVTEIISTLSSPNDKQVIEIRKRDFIRQSKKFSITLKDFFREGHAQSVFVSALSLLNQTNAIQYAIKVKCDK